MKKSVLFSIFTLSCIALTSPARGADWVSTYDGLLQKYVTSSGVNYRAWHGSKTDISALSGVVDAIGKESLEGKSKDEKLAFYLNAYNAWILHNILSDYPTDGPGGGGFIGRTAFFKRDNLKVAGKTTDFSSLENDIIRPEFKESRVHFALNCASESCPPLNTHAFSASSLDATLNQLATQFLNNNPRGLKVSGGKAEVSKIFDWYGDDFKSTGSVLDYINQYRSSPIPKGTSVSFQDYSWKLNESR